MRGARCVARVAWRALGGARCVARVAWRELHSARRMALVARRALDCARRVARVAWRESRGARRVARVAWRALRGARCVARVAWRALRGARRVARVAWRAWGGDPAAAERQTQTTEATNKQARLPSLCLCLCVFVYVFRSMCLRLPRTSKRQQRCKTNKHAFLHCPHKTPCSKENVKGESQHLFASACQPRCAHTFSAFWL